MNKKLGIFGPYPPPLGGISVHISRLEAFLKKEKIDYEIYNHGFLEQENIIATKKKLVWYFKMLFIREFNTFHFHQFFLFHFLYYFIFSILRDEKIIVTIHSERILSYSRIKRKVILFFIRNTKRLYLISVSKNLSNFLKGEGIKAQFLPAYVPPIQVDKVVVKHTKKIFLFSVWKFNEKLANDIYNVKIAFEFLKNNKNKYQMLFMIGNRSGSDELYLDKLIKTYQIEEHIIIMYDKNLTNYLNNCEFLLRPNLSDGYGVSIQEALDLGVPAIASDVCERPKGAILFKNNDYQDLLSKINYLENTPINFIISKKKNLNYHYQLINIYKELLTA